MTNEIDEVYRERNRVVAALARIFPSGVAKTDIPGWAPEWHGCVYIDLPTGQVSWHFHESDAGLFASLPTYASRWDGHDTAEKYRRLEEFWRTADTKREMEFRMARARALAGIP